MAKNKIPKTPDGRKYRMSIICLLVLLAGFALCSINPVFVTLYSELITAVLGVLFVYAGGNVANKFAIGKAGGLTVGAGSNNVNNEGASDGPVT